MVHWVCGGVGCSAWLFETGHGIGCGVSIGNRGIAVVGLKLHRAGWNIELRRYGCGPVVEWLGSEKFGKVWCSGVWILGAGASYRDGAVLLLQWVVLDGRSETYLVH